MVRTVGSSVEGQRVSTEWMDGRRVREPHPWGKKVVAVTKNEAAAGIGTIELGVRDFLRV
jgi:hypothetical protein